jgi:hypothetical protein
MKEFKTKPRKLPVAAVIATATLFVFRCANISGGGSEAGNARIIGMVVNAQGAPAGNVAVRIMPADYDPVKDKPVSGEMIDTTGPDGMYRFFVTDGCRYTIQAVHAVLRLRALIPLVEAVQTDNTAPGCTLQTPGTIRVPLSAGMDTVSGYVYIPGTTIYSFLKNAKNSTFLDSVPYGAVPSVKYSTLNTSQDAVVGRNINVSPGDTVTVAYLNWAYSAVIALNTSVSGANVQGNVYGFPVLVRLRANNFNFRHAGTNGDDIRFAKSDGSPLYYEIERWDPVAELAEVWVKVDTIFGNDSTQTIIMYWGNPDASSLSAGGAVFDTTAGFQGVWHLGDAAGDSVQDATNNRYNGGSPDSARPQTATGMIGNCRRFNGSADFITMPNTAGGKLNFPEDGNFTVSAWVFIDAFGDIPQLIVSKGYEQYFLWAASYPNESPYWEFNEFNESTNWESSRTSAATGKWVHLVGVRQGKDQFLYCNGALVDSVKDVWPWGISRDTLDNLSIGGFLEGIYDPVYEGYCHFKGMIDEVRILSGAQSPDWVRLCYMNQNGDDTFVIFK